MLMNGLLASAQPIQTPEGKMPLVHWAIVESTEGNMPTILSLGAKHVAPITAQESGTYALYGGIDKENPNMLRILEIYADENAYQIHRSSEGFKQYQSDRVPALAKLTLIEVDPIVLEQKTAGTGSSVYMDLITIKKDKLKDYEALVTKEMKRAVNEEEGVLGLFAAAAKDDPEKIYTMGIYTDQAAYEHYISSQAYKAFKKSAEPMIEMHQPIENQPAKIVLSSKGLN